MMDDQNNNLFGALYPIFARLADTPLRNAIQNEYGRRFRLNEPPGEALQATLRYFKLIPEPVSTMMATAAEYDDIIAAQDIMEGL